MSYSYYRKLSASISYCFCQFLKYPTWLYVTPCVNRSFSGFFRDIFLRVARNCERVKKLLSCSAVTFSEWAGTQLVFGQFFSFRSRRTAQASREFGDWYCVRERRVLLFWICYGCVSSFYTRYFKNELKLKAIKQNVLFIISFATVI